MAKSPPATLRSATDAVQRRLITAALKATGGNVDAASRKLAVDRTYLYKLMKRLGIVGLTDGRNRYKGRATR